MPHLRIYNGPEAEKTEPEVRNGQVTVSLGQIFPMLADAFRSNRTWLHDFEDDEISISADLYDLIMAYQHFRPSA